METITKWTHEVGQASMENPVLKIMSYKCEIPQDMVYLTGHTILDAIARKINGAELYQLLLNEGPNKAWAECVVMSLKMFAGA